MAQVVAFYSPFFVFKGGTMADIKDKYHIFVKPRLIEVEAWKRDGLTDEQIMGNLGISKATFYKYKAKYKELEQALIKGKEVADIEVENALFKRAVGYNYIERIKETKEINGKTTVIIKEVEKHMAGDTVAQIFWLKNRKPNKWKDRQEEVADTNISIEILGVNDETKD